MAAIPHLSRAALRELDRLAVEELFLPEVVLMENAGRGAAEAILAELDASHGGSEVELAVFCGGGNNGGDGYVLARHLHNAGRRVLVCEAKAPAELGAAAACFRRVTAAMGLEHAALGAGGLDPPLASRLARAAVLVDALLGTGARGEPREPLATWIRALNELGRLAGSGRVPVVVALDVPSGLDADTGAPARATVRAARTLTFAAPKLGFLAPSARPYIGRLQVLPIGTPPELLLRALASARDEPEPGCR